MAAEPNAVEQAVSRTLRDNLEKIQRTADELHQAVNDMVAACASSRSSNALPSMLRAQTSAASLAATLEVLSRFVTGALQPPVRMPFEPDTLRVPSPGAPPVPAFEQPPSAPSHPIEEFSWETPAPVVQAPRVSEIAPPVEPLPAVPEIHYPVEAPAPSNFSAAAEMPAAVEPAPALEPVFFADPVPVTLREPAPDFELELPVAAHQAVPSAPASKPVEASPVFNLDSLPPEEQ